MSEKELEKKKTKLEKELGAVNDELRKIFVDKNKPSLEKRYTDTYWKYKNTYDGKVYIHAKKLDPDWVNDGMFRSISVICDTAQITDSGVIQIEINRVWNEFLFETKISKYEYQKAVSEILAKAEGVQV